MIYTDPVKAAPVFAAQIAAANRIVLLSHVNPDGDAIGSLLGAYHALTALGKTALPVVSSDLPAYAAWLPGIEAATMYQPGDALPDCDLVWMLDTASLPRVGKPYEEHATILAEKPLIIVDHHVTNDGGGLVNLINPEAASTGELLYRLLVAMELPISAEAASCLLLGVVTDTQSFQTSSTRPASLRVAADLIELGADNARLIHEVYFALPQSSAELIALALSNIGRDGDIAWTTITYSMMQQTGAEDEAGDEVVRFIQRIDGIKALALFKERADGQTKISLRSVPPYNVATLAKQWGGGGHAQAAGATLRMGLSQAAEAVLPLLRELVSGQNNG